MFNLIVIVHWIDEGSRILSDKKGMRKCLTLNPTYTKTLLTLLLT